MMSERVSVGRLAEVFDELLDLDADARRRRLDAAAMHPSDRTQLERMLAADDEHTSGFLDSSAAVHALAFESDADAGVEPGNLVGKQFGPFRLTALLGQGGMATVFLGERVGADFDQQVAVKVLRRGLYSSIEQQLFRRERQLLAQLDHPNIARLIDGGLTDAGIPYLVMEYVDGLRLDQHMRTHRLDLHARLRLFVEACSAVQAAHQALIVHRDIKPSNILVTTAGLPKLLDFGIAKLLVDDPSGAPTRTLTAALTPGYAAPEQMAGASVTTAADIYALGVVLHEIVTGARPLPADVVLASASVKPGADDGRLPMESVALRRALRGDLDNIIMRALSPEPLHRYASVAAFVEDIENHLDGRPVKAHPPSRWYLTAKFARRHRAAVAVAVAMSALVVGALGVALWQARSATTEAERANAVRDFVVSIFKTAEAERPRDERPTPEDVIAAGIRRATTDDDLPDATRAEMLSVLSQVAISMGVGDARKTTQELVALTDRLHLPGDPEWIEARTLRAKSLLWAADFPAAIAILEPLREGLLRRADPAAIDALISLEEATVKQGNSAEASTAFRYQQIRTAALQLADTHPEVVLTALIAEVDGLAAVHRFKDALARGEITLQFWERMGKPMRPEILWLYGSVGNAASSLGDLARGERAYRDAIALADRLYAGPHMSKAWFVGLLGSFLVAHGRLDEAEPLVLQGLQMRKDLLGPSNEQTIFGINAAARLRAAQRRRPEAVAFANEAVANCEAASSKSTGCMAALYTRARIRAFDQEFEQAEKDMLAAIAMQRGMSGTESALVATPIGYLAELQRQMGRYEDAIASANVALGMWTEVGGGHWAEVANARYQRAWSLFELGRHAEALAEITQVESEFALKSPANTKTRAGMLRLLARAQSRAGRYDDARRSAKQSIELIGDPSTADPGVVAQLERLAATGKDV